MCQLHVCNCTMCQMMVCEWIDGRVGWGGYGGEGMKDGWEDRGRWDAWRRVGMVGEG